jgi:hypothetical protein
VNSELWNLLSQHRKGCDEEEEDTPTQDENSTRLLIAMLAQIRKLVLGIQTGGSISEEVYIRIQAIIEQVINAIECVNICEESLLILRTYMIEAITLVVTPGWSEYGLPELQTTIKRCCAGMNARLGGLSMINYILLRRLVQRI